MGGGRGAGGGGIRWADQVQAHSGVSFTFEGVVSCQANWMTHMQGSQRGSCQAGAHTQAGSAKLRAPNPRWVLHVCMAL